MISLRDITASELAVIEEGSIHLAGKALNGEVIGIEKIGDISDSDAFDLIRDNLSTLDEWFYEIENVHVYFYHLKGATAWT